MDDDDPRRPALSVRVARGSHCLAENDVDAAVRAREVSERLGDPERAAEAEALRSAMLWYRGEGGPALEAADAALAIVADRPASSQKARALANRARRASLQDDSELALRLAAEAESMASALGLGDLVSHALNTRGMARIELGELAGLDDLRRSVVIAQDGNHVHEWFVGLNNLANLNWYVGRLDEGAQEMARYVELAERLGAPAYMDWGQVGVMLVPYLRGEYRDVVKLATAALAQLSGGTSYQEIPIRSMLTVAHAASGSAALALAEAPLALTAARTADDPQVLAPALVGMAMAHWAGGQAAELERAVNELLDTPKLMHYGQWVSPLALLLQELGQTDRSQVLAGALSPGTRWREAAGALAGGRRADAAAIYETIGSRFLAGWASLLAAEHGEFDAGRLREAAAHFDRAGATPYAARCSELFSGPSSRASTRG